MPQDEEPRQRLLYLTPVAPSLGGNGLAMRAGAVLRILARHHAVQLAVLPLYPPYDGAVPPELARLCEAVTVLDAARAAPAGPPSGWLARLLARLSRAGPAAPPPLPFPNVRFDIVHAFRLATADLARRRAAAADGGQPALHLDLDDIESDVLDGLAELHRRAGRRRRARAAAEAAVAARAREDEAFRDFDRVYVCSEADGTRLAPRSVARILVLPNTVEAVSDPPPPPADGAFRFLFVGTLGYTPNADAVEYVCSEVVPRIRRLTRRDFHVVIAGGGAPRRLARFGRLSHVTLAGPVPDLAPLYRSCSAALVPLRAGGGTRIKALEAFSHRRTVVGTSVGIAGIDVRHGEHVLVGDTPDAIARCCVRLIEDRALADRLGAAALERVTRQYSAAAVAASLEPFATPPGPAGVEAS